MSVFKRVLYPPPFIRQQGNNKQKPKDNQTETKVEPKDNQTETQS